jgi:outer membrane receptor protein involved in Fe transport
MLDAETLVGGDAGTDVRIGRVSLEANGFWNEVDAFIGDVVVGFSPFTVERQNVGRLRSRGLETIANATLGGGWAAEVGFVYTESEVIDSADPELVGNRGEGAPERVWTGAIGFAPPVGFGFQVRARYLSDQFQDISNELYIPEHHVIDASARYVTPAGWEVFLEGKNVLDEEYIVEAEAGGLGAPLQVLVGARARLGAR